MRRPASLAAQVLSPRTYPAFRPLSPRCSGVGRRSRGGQVTWRTGHVEGEVPLRYPARSAGVPSPRPRPQSSPLDYPVFSPPHLPGIHIPVPVPPPKSFPPGLPGGLVTGLVEDKAPCALPGVQVLPSRVPPPGYPAFGFSAAYPALASPSPSHCPQVLPPSPTRR